jgi:actin-related protein 5
MDQLRLFGYADIEELQAAIVAEQKELDRMMGIEEPKEAPDYSLVDIPDSNLSPEQIKEKRKQRLLKNSAEARERMRKEKEEEAQRAGEQKKALDQRRLNDFSGWKNDLYTERQELTKMIKVRQKKKEALSDRKSQAAGARLRNVVALVEEDEEEALNAKSTKSNATKRKKTTKQPAIPENDGFGDNDADWLIYRQINRDDEAEGERDEEIQKRLSEIEEQLEQFDPDAFFDLVASEMSKAVTIVDRLKNGVTDEGDDPSARANQLHVNVERYRAVEGLFQPGAILGLDQAGLVETIEDLLKVVAPSQRDSLSANIFLTGGACQAEGLVARLEQDLRAVLQVGAPLSITLGTDPILDTWRGAALLCREDSSNLPWITREWYQEHGGERLPSNSWFTNPH